MISGLFEANITSDRLWSQVIGNFEQTKGRAALFLDRDGVIVEEVNYLHRVEDVRLISGAADVIKKANQMAIPVIIVTNQAGIGRNYYDWPQFDLVQKKILAELFDADAQVNAVFACPYHSDARPPYYDPNHPARKPNPGMLKMAEAQLGIDLSGSWIAGDRAIDVRTGLNAGCAGGIHLTTGHGSRENEKSTALALARKNYQVLSLNSIADLLTELPLFNVQTTTGRSG
ncbi:MAG: hypothetical protein CMM74_11630 [Rhodospirillaceae bacterium]|nr:hypothetical protein [Rhodospirillaceae bacterium]